MCLYKTKNSYLFIVRFHHDLQISTCSEHFLYLYWQGPLMKDHRLKVFENGILRRIFGPKRNKLIAGWRKLAYNLYSLPNLIRIIKWRRSKWAWHVSWMREKRNAYRVLVLIHTWDKYPWSVLYVVCSKTTLVSCGITLSY